MKSKTYEFRFGGYKRPPQHEDPIKIELPEDTLFVTGGPYDIGKGLYEGALHILAITKSKNLKKIYEQGHSHPNIVEVGSVFDCKELRINGYGFILFQNCIASGVKFSSVDEFNEALDLNNHPQYFLLRTEEAFSTIYRLNKISYYNNVNFSSVQLRAQLNDYYYPWIEPDEDTSLDKFLIPYYKHKTILLKESYGKELFDEALYYSLSKIYPEFSNKLKGYDLDWIYRNKDKVKECYDRLTNDLVNGSSGYDSSEDSDFIRLYGDVFNLRKKLPMIKKSNG